MTPSGPFRLSSLAAQQRVLLGMLLALAGAAWALTMYQSDANSMDMGLTMGLTGPVFLTVWATMMVAMMLPSAAPMIVVFSRVSQQKQARGQISVPTGVFVAAYFAVWIASGVVAYLGASEIQDAAMGSTWIQENGARLAPFSAPK